MNLKKYIIIFLLIVLSSFLWVENVLASPISSWQVLESGNNMSKVFIDVNSINITGDRVSFNSIWRYNPLLKVSTQDSVEVEVSTDVVDCKNTTIGTLKMESYDGKGNLLNNFDLAEMGIPLNMSSVNGNSLVSAVINSVCNLQPIY